MRDEELSEKLSWVARAAYVPDSEEIESARMREIHRSLSAMHITEQRAEAADGFRAHILVESDIVRGQRYVVPREDGYVDLTTSIDVTPHPDIDAVRKAAIEADGVEILVDRHLLIDALRMPCDTEGIGGMVRLRVPKEKFNAIVVSSPNSEMIAVVMPMQNQYHIGEKKE